MKKGTDRAEVKVLEVLYLFYKEYGPGAVPNMKGLDAEAEITKYELEDAVESLKSKGLIEYWELGPAVRLSEEGLRLVVRMEREREGKD